MKIRVNKNGTDLASIKEGECFWYCGKLYMRIFGLVLFADADKIPLVILSTGCYAELNPDTQVEKANCMVVNDDKISTDTVEK